MALALSSWRGETRRLEREKAWKRRRDLGGRRRRRRSPDDARGKPGRRRTGGGARGRALVVTAALGPGWARSGLETNARVFCAKTKRFLRYPLKIGLRVELSQTKGLFRKNADDVRAEALRALLVGKDIYIIYIIYIGIGIGIGIGKD